jgi:hypothetical protein
MIKQAVTSSSASIRMCRVEAGRFSNDERSVANADGCRQMLMLAQMLLELAYPNQGSVVLQEPRVLQSSGNGSMTARVSRGS